MASDAAEPSPRRTVGAPVTLIVGVAAGVIVVDQLTKWWAVETLSDRTIDLFWTLRLRLLRNFGSAFSLTDNSGPVLSIVAVVVVFLLIRSGRRLRSPLVLSSYGLVTGGALGNVVDRLFRAGDGFLGGGVIDFVDLQWFPVFNVADAAITIGVGLLLLASFRDPDGLEPTGAGPPAGST